ncbi:uncharacterized protein LOC125757728 [Rhipicephalus sanguineus]|uniref:uncharacterized protein LOC125757728 n=1 Tax=Rhipicephalus sanguineus TaxID=34632 RepID=UPI0020C596B8|nr:uncharacterized protein LOC125757728 [Rhipicephalus sanguineus]
MFAEDVTRLCRRADPSMSEEKKLRYLMRGVKEQLFAGLVRNAPTTVADFIREATAIERALHQRSRQYDRSSTTTQINAASVTLDNQGSLRDLIRDVVREELQKLCTPPVDTPVTAVAAVVHDELRHAFSAVDLGREQRQMSYADAVRRPPPVVPITSYYQPPTAAPSSQPLQEAFRRRPMSPMSSCHQPSLAAPYSPPQEDMRRPQFRRTDAWRTVDRRPLCFNCGGAGHIARYCWYRDTSFRPSRPGYDGRRANADCTVRHDDPGFRGPPTTCSPYHESLPNRQPNSATGHALHPLHRHRHRIDGLLLTFGEQGRPALTGETKGGDLSG